MLIYIYERVRQTVSFGNRHRNSRPTINWLAGWLVRVAIGRVLPAADTIRTKKRSHAAAAAAAAQLQKNPNPQQSPDPRWSPSPSSKGTKVRVSYPGANHSTAAKSNSSGRWPKLPRWQSPEPAPRFQVGSEPNACPGQRTMCGTRTLVSGQQSSRGLDQQSRLYSRCTPFPTSSRDRMNHAQTSWTASDWRSTCFITMSQPQTRPPSPTTVSYTHLTLPTNREV